MRTVPQLIAAARRRGCPLVAVNTTDPSRSLVAICEALGSEDEATGEPILKYTWDYVRGFLPLNGASQKHKLPACDADPVEALKVLGATLPAGSVCFMFMADRYLRDDSPFATPVAQAIWNLRDDFKRNRRVLVMLSNYMRLPADLTQDVILLDEPMPDRDETAQIIERIHKAAALDIAGDNLLRACEAAQGQSAYAIEQSTALSLTPQGLNMDELWERKRKQIEQTPGLKVYRGKERFTDIGGVLAAKDVLRKLIAGNGRGECMVWMDEIDKVFASGDLSGVSDDQKGALLSWMENNEVFGCLLLGPPGTSKSMISKAAGNEAGVLTVGFDIGATKGSLVGESERKFRDCLRTITAVSNNKPMVLATCNRADHLDTALQRRFRLKFFFDLPDREEKDSIWTIQQKRFGIDLPLPEDHLWAGANIRDCCEIAWRMGCDLEAASQFITPVGVVSAKETAALREYAASHGLLSASRPGPYEMPAHETNGRSITL